jgi:DMSO/TMAO reductase YedYZ heme-binding membrane subunit
MGFGKWKFVQRFVYLAFILSFLHFVLYTNGLFVPIQNGKIFVNLIEVGLILLGLLTILLQIGGFVKTIYLKSSKKEEAV